MANKIWDIFTTWDHWKAPFTLKIAPLPGTQAGIQRLSQDQRIKAVALGVLIGLFTFGIGGVFFFFGYTAHLKCRRIKILKLKHPSGSLSAPTQTPAKVQDVASQKLDPKSPAETAPAAPTPPAHPDPAPAPAANSPQVQPGPPAPPSDPNPASSINHAFKSIVKSVSSLLSNKPKPLPDLDPNAPIPPRPAGGIQVGLINLGATCWLNSALKFLASTDYYEGIFTVNVNSLNVSAERKAHLLQAQTALRHAIIRLRSGIPLDKTETDAANDERENLYNTLVGSLHNLWPDLNIWGDQLDSMEFISDLHTAFHYPLNKTLDKKKATADVKNKYSQTLVQYKPLQPGIVKYATLENFDIQIKLEIPLEEFDKPEPINIPDIFRLDGNLTVRHDFTLGETVNLQNDPDNNGQVFNKERVLINAPPVLVINFKRIMAKTVIDEGTFVGFEKHKCEREIALGPNDTITFLEYDIDKIGLDEKLMGTHIQAKNICTYQVEAAICHGGSAYGGHYTAYERSADGKLLFHNDSSVTAIPPEEALDGWKRATVLRLKLIDKKPYKKTPGECPAS